MRPGHPSELVASGVGLLQEARRPEHPDPHRLGVVGHEVVVVGGGSRAWAVGLSAWVMLNHPSDRRTPRCHDPP